MPFVPESLTSMRDGILQDIASAQIQSASSGTVLTQLLNRSILRVLAYAQAGLSYEHYGYLDWIAKQAVPWSADGEFMEAWANLKGVYRLQPTATQGTLTFTGSQTIPGGSTVNRSDGTAYTTLADAAPSGGSVATTVQAVVAGSAGNFSTGTAFSLASPIGSVNSATTSSVQTIAGTDTETDTALRTRMLAAYAAPPQGGDRYDYIEWALAVPGVTRAWVTPLGMGAGTVVVYVMLDIAEAAYGGFPQGVGGTATAEPRDVSATGDLLTVANALYPQQPVTALVYVVPPTAQPTNFTITGLGSNNTTAMQTQIQAALTNMFARLGQVGGTINPTTGATWPGIEPSDWYAAIDAIPGLNEFTVPSPAAIIAPSAGNLLTLGTVSYSS